MQGKPLKISGAALSVKSNSSYFPLSSEKPLISDNDGKFNGKLVLGEHPCDASLNPEFIYPKVEGYYFSDSDLKLNLNSSANKYSLGGSFIAYAKKNYMKLTITSKDSLVSKLAYHSHLVKSFFDHASPYIIPYDEYAFVDFKSGMTQTIVVPSVRDAKSFFDFNLLDKNIPANTLKNTVYINNDKDLRWFVFPAVDKDTVDYSLIISKL
jgi:hypothetical protein